MLHRLDHSIHTMRLWGNTKAKELCSDWNMNMFFRLIHNDMFGICSDRLNEMRAPGMFKHEKKYSILVDPREEECLNVNFRV